MKILLISKEYPPRGSGIGRTAYNLVKGFQQLGETVNVVNEETIARDRVHNCKRRLGGATYGIADLASFWHKAIRYASEIGEFDLLWLHQPYALPWITRKWLLKSGWKVAITWHSTYLGWKRAILEGGCSPLLAGYYTVCSEVESAFAKSLKGIPSLINTVVSPHICEELRQQGLKGGDIKFVPNGVLNDQPIARGTATLESEDAARVRFGLSADSKILVYAGSLTMIKQPTRLVEAYEIIRGQYPEVRLLIIGTGPLYPYLKRIAERRKGISLLGQKDPQSVLTLLRISDVFISFSLYEGMSNAELEAASCGLPLLVSDISAHRDIKNLGITPVSLVRSSPHLNRKDVLMGFDSINDRNVIRHGYAINGSTRSMYGWNSVCQSYLQTFREQTDQKGALEFLWPHLNSRILG